jgi:AcrR family transcriptional regulator
MARTAAPGSRERILRSAGALFYTRGVRAVGMAEVIDQAGCGKNLLYGHFPSKTDLVAAYLTDTRDRLDRALDRRLAQEPADNPAARLRRLLREVSVMAQGRGCAFRNYLTEFPGEDDEPARIARAYVQTTRDRVAELVTRIGPAEPERTTERILLVLEGLYATAGRPDAATHAAAAQRFVDDLVSAG